MFDCKNFMYIIGLKFCMCYQNLFYGFIYLYFNFVLIYID